LIELSLRMVPPTRGAALRWLAPGRAPRWEKAGFQGGNEGKNFILWFLGGARKWREKRSKSCLQRPDEFAFAVDVADAIDVVGS
jgi:hypothetical protein